ncbi:hypothetical protein [Bacillus sp. UNC41MFS5]|uniref:hypothetical protein n=1 Tax=Bacillus sp. UNC41MFS5 TaxID=1449046 RepID=UPI00047A9A57|nr:hypothetical protein [Bacillus sp. UNC41MFS5]
MDTRVEKLINTTQSIFGILIVIGFIPGIMMGMIFDAPGSEKEIFRWILFLSYPCFVVTVILTVLASKRFLRDGQHLKSAMLNVFPALWIIEGLCLFIYWWLQGES